MTQTFVICYVSSDLTHFTDDVVVMCGVFPLRGWVADLSIQLL